MSARSFGFPIPGLQDPSPESVVGIDYFVGDNEWEDILNDGDYDFVVIGSSFMAYAFIQAAFQKNPNLRILVLERGSMWLPSHFQNLPLPFRYFSAPEGKAETFPWTLSEQTYNPPDVPGLPKAFLHGSCPFFGGRSTLWSAWAPNPTPDLFRDFPESMLQTIDADFWRRADRLLHVIRASKIKTPSYVSLQPHVDQILHDNISKIPGAISSEAGLLAAGPNQPTSIIQFAKYSVPAPLLSLLEQVRARFKSGAATGTLQIVTDCVVQKLGARQEKHARSVETSRGTLSFPSNNTKIILCCGTVPNATLVLNSFPHLRRSAGHRLTGHSMSQVQARVPKEALGQKGDTLRIAANYLYGKHENGLQYHFDITAIYSPHPDKQAEDLARECPEFLAAPTKEQLETSRDKVIIVFASLNEMDEQGKSHVRFNGDPDPTTNVTLHYDYTQKHKDLWDLSDDAMFAAVEVMSNGTELEYWHQTGGPNGGGEWKKDKPPLNEIRLPGVVHEASTLFMGSEHEKGSVDENYRLHGTDNVYVAGAALFPTAGSWNPTVTMCGFAQDLAERIVSSPSA